jgi:hypothetical protein
MATPQIQIDNFIFTLIAKSINDEKGYTFNEHSFIEDRNKIIFSSLDTITNKTIINHAYASVSDGGLWRLCYIDEDNNPIKFNNYLQDTQLHMELQKFIYINFDSLEYVKDSDFIIEDSIDDKEEQTSFIATPINTPNTINPNGIISCKITNDDIADYINGSAPNNSRQINIFESTINLYVSEDLQKSHIIQSINADYEYEYDYKNIQNKLQIYKINLILKNTELSELLTNTEILEQSKTIDNLKLDKLKKQLDIKTDSKKQLKLELSIIEKNIIDEIKNLQQKLPTNLEDTLENFDHSDFNDFLKKLIDYSNITIYCAKIIITDIPLEHTITNYFNCNIIPNNTSIDKYGLYKKYIKGYSDDYKINSFISKPIDYKKRIFQHNLSLIYDDSDNDENKIIINASPLEKESKLNYVIFRFIDQPIFPLNQLYDSIGSAAIGGKKSKKNKSKSKKTKSKSKKTKSKKTKSKSKKNKSKSKK